MIYRKPNSGAFSDVAIGLETSPGTQVYNNTVYMEDGYPNAIEYRFSATGGITINNNLTNKAIRSRDGASGAVSSNITNATSAWFRRISNGDLHLANSIAGIVDAGLSITGLTDDYDRERRPMGQGIDIGADEYSPSGIPLPPENLRFE
jgi:hypothetical protein